MAIKIIDNRKVDLTEDECQAYERICTSYDDPPAVKGKDLFAGLFETDENGIIVFLKAPHNRMCSFEVYLFVSNLMIHQHLRLNHKLVESLAKRVDEKLKLIDNTIEKLEEKTNIKSKSK